MSRYSTDNDAAVAGGGLLHRRLLLRRTFQLAGLAGLAGSTSAIAQDASVPSAFPAWMTQQGSGPTAYGVPSAFEADVQRGVRPPNPIAPGIGVSLTPLERLQGVITPNGLHFERHHASVPEIDPAQHRLIIHGLVSQPLVFDVDALLRYPMVSRIHFLECGGNSGANLRAEAPQASCGTIHGLVSCAEWTGVPLSTLLDEAGLDPAATWVTAEGADADSMVRSLPIEKALDDAMVALYQNGERLRPGQGYPMRLLAPGWEGNLNVKWLHRLKATDEPAHARDETAQYTDLLPDGTARQFTLVMGVKSVITHPSGGLAMGPPGFYEISGLAWSGHGAIRRVEISADGGASWADAALDGVVLPRCLTRFRLPWRWEGAPSVLMSRATDDQGNVQPTREAVLAQYASANFYHNNAIQNWAVGADGGIANVFA